MLTQDTYRGEKNDPSSLHLYSYCSNNPINFVDPSGHKHSGGPKKKSKRPKNGSKGWFCTKTTKKGLRKTIAPIYKNKPTKTLLKKWIGGQFTEEFIAASGIKSKYKIMRSARKLYNKAWGINLITGSYTLGLALWNGGQHNIWKKINNYYKKNLKNSKWKKIKDSTTVWFCMKMSFQRKGSKSGAYLPTGTVKLSRKKPKH